MDRVILPNFSVPHPLYQRLLTVKLAHLSSQTSHQHVKLECCWNSLLVCSAIGQAAFWLLAAALLQLASWPQLAL
jgi:hypothetical protein